MKISKGSEVKLRIYLVLNKGESGVGRGSEASKEVGNLQVVEEL